MGAASMYVSKSSQYSRPAQLPGGSPVSGWPESRAPESLDPEPESPRPESQPDAEGHDAASSVIVASARAAASVASADPGLELQPRIVTTSPAAGKTRGIQTRRRRTRDP